MTTEGSRSSPAWDDPLEQLFTEVQLLATPKKSAKPKDPAQRNAAEIRALFLKPENWERTRGVALVHAETDTLLGNFSEYVHRSVPNTRKLLRESSPITIHRVEKVSGSWWLAERRPYVDASMQWNTQREAVVAVQLPELGVAHPLCELTVGLYLGGITRVELSADTQFAGPGGKELLFLPKGTNILECMSTDSKIALRLELGL